jgi:hypothetical protein
VLPNNDEGKVIADAWFGKGLAARNVQRIKTAGAMSKIKVLGEDCFFNRASFDGMMMMVMTDMTVMTGKT